jgi:hypothetical protein
LLATSSTGGTAIGARFINGSTSVLNRITLEFTGAVWRQSNVPKTLQFYYYIDPTGTNTFPGSATAYLPGLDVNIPTDAAAAGGVAVDGTSTLNQTNRCVINQVISNWLPGAALWLVWQMTDSIGKAQGLGIDNLNFSANVAPPVPLVIQVAGTNLVLSWPAAASQRYQLEFKDDLAAPAWTPVGNPVAGTSGSLTLTNEIGISPERFFRFRLVN